MTVKQALSLREICDATEMQRLQETKPFTMTDITIEGSALRIEFSDRVENASKKKRGLLYEASEVLFECGDEAMAKRWNAALCGGEKISPADLMPAKQRNAPAAAAVESAPIQTAKPVDSERLLLEAKMIFNTQTGRKDTLRLRFSAEKNGTIPYETVPFPCVDSARQAQQQYTKEAKRNIGFMATVSP